MPPFVLSLMAITKTITKNTHKTTSTNQIYFSIFDASNGKIIGFTKSYVDNFVLNKPIVYIMNNKYSVIL